MPVRDPQVTFGRQRRYPSSYRPLQEQAGVVNVSFAGASGLQATEALATGLAGSETSWLSVSEW